jgi:hypothetical protein
MLAHVHLTVKTNLLTMKRACANHVVRQVMLMILPITVFTIVQIIDTKTTKINFALKNDFVE